MPSKFLKNVLLGTLCVFTLLLTTVLQGCRGLIDPTPVQNDQVTDDNLRANAQGGARPLLTGLRLTFSRATGNLLTVTELVSDNYTNVTSFVSQLLDTPRDITGTDLTLSLNSGIYVRTQELHALADFGLQTILPNDPTTTNLQRAETWFYKGFALLLLSENFSRFPIADKGQPISAAAARDTAISAFNTALALAGTNPPTDPLYGNVRSNCLLALARAYRLQGNKTLAAQFAEQALAFNPSYVFFARYDPQNLNSEISQHVRIRTDNNFQPLPRLDFLDPKLVSVPGSDPISMLKTEEAHLVLAEIALSNNDLATAKTRMGQAVTLARSRPTVQFTDVAPNENRPSYPIGASAAAASVRVRASPTAPEDTGLIRRRGVGSSAFTLPTVSGTSRTVAGINALPNDRRVLARELYLLRQEIFFLEGRRMSDLGIRLPVVERQTQGNPNMPFGSEGTLVSVPEWIPTGIAAMNQFTIAGSVITIQFDMNQVIADNIARVSPFSGW